MSELTNTWSPSTQDVRQGQEAYLRYASGVGILNDPHAEFAAGVLGEGCDVDANPESIIVLAESLMYTNLSRLAKLANPPDIRGDKGRIEQRYEQALPHIMSFVDSVLASEVGQMRLDRINPALIVFRPSPLEDQFLYRHICHGRRQKIETVRLLDGMGVAIWFEGLLDGRTLHSDYDSSQGLTANGA
ncbi:MAG: hypothetical protein ACREGB_04085 [Candidatus Saccharimonadales bacterium]